MDYLMDWDLSAALKRRMIVCLGWGPSNPAGQFDRPRQRMALGHETAMGGYIHTPNRHRDRQDTPVIQGNQQVTIESDYELTSKRSATSMKETPVRILYYLHMQ